MQQIASNVDVQQAGPQGEGPGGSGNQGPPQHLGPQQVGHHGDNFLLV